MTRELQRSALAPPPREGWGGVARRWWRARGRHPGLRYWLLFRGTPALVVFGVLYTVNGVLIGWSVAYDVMVGIKSPADVTGDPVVAWVLSIAGWLLGPAVAGAVVGYLVTSAIGGRRRPVEQLFTEADRG